jgi:LysM repeat protein
MQVAHYMVHRGDTIASIASHFATKPEVIRQLNDLEPMTLPVIDTTCACPRRTSSCPEKAARAALAGRHTGRPAAPTRGQAQHSRGASGRYALCAGTAPGDGSTDPGSDQRSEPQRSAASWPEAAVSSASARGHRRFAASRAHSRVPRTQRAPRRMTYVVRRGDTLYGIARLLQVTVNDLAGWNGMSGVPTASSRVRR